jgi:hypothetical protein
LADGRGYEYDIPAVLEADLLEVFFYDLHKRITELNWKVGFVNKDGNMVSKKYGFYFKNGSFSEYLGALGDCDRKKVHSVLLVSAGGGLDSLDLMGFSCIGNKEYTIGGGSFDRFYIRRAKIILPTADFQKEAERLSYSDLRKPASLTTDFFVSGEMTLAELENLKKIEVTRVK